MIRVLTITCRLIWFAICLIAFMLTGLLLIPCLAWDFAAGTDSAGRLVQGLEDFWDIPGRGD